VISRVGGLQSQDADILLYEALKRLFWRFISFGMNWLFTGHTSGMNHGIIREELL